MTALCHGHGIGQWHTDIDNACTGGITAMQRGAVRGKQLLPLR